MDVRGDQEDPREQADTDAEDERVDQRRPVTPGRPTLDQNVQPREEDGVDRQVERVAHRRERHVGVEDLAVAVGVDVAAEVEELAGREQPPRRAGARAVHPDTDDDRDDAREPEQVDQGPVPGDARHEQVQTGNECRDGEVGRPGVLARDETGSVEVHAARSLVRAGCRSKRFTRRPRTSSSCSISASVLAAVSWMRKPTSLLGTSGYAASVT